jgi:hypothetical protein
VNGEGKEGGKGPPPQVHCSRRRIPCFLKVYSLILKQGILARKRFKTQKILVTRMCARWKKLAKFPVFFPVSRETPQETGFG